MNSISFCAKNDRLALDKFLNEIISWFGQNETRIFVLVLGKSESPKRERRSAASTLAGASGLSGGAPGISRAQPLSSKTGLELFYVRQDRKKETLSTSRTFWPLES